MIVIDEIDSLKVCECPITSFCSDSSRRRIFAGNWDGDINIVRLRNLSVEKSFKAHYSYVSALAVSSEGFLVSGGMDSRISFWDLKRNSKKGDLEMSSGVSSFYVAGDILFAGLSDGIVSIVDAGVFEKLKDVRIGTSSFVVSGLAFDETNHVLYVGTVDKKLSMWQLSEECDDLLFIKEREVPNRIVKLGLGGDPCSLIAYMGDYLSSYRPTNLGLIQKFYVFRADQTTRVFQVLDDQLLDFSGNNFFIFDEFSKKLLFFSMNSFECLKGLRMNDSFQFSLLVRDRLFMANKEGMVKRFRFQFDVSNYSIATAANEEETLIESKIGGSPKKKDSQGEDSDMEEESASEIETESESEDGSHSSVLESDSESYVDSDEDLDDVD